MKDRCRLPTHQAWANYGGRGVSVCSAWQASFEAFWADMGPTYAKGLTLDRLDNSGDYTPENCAWRTYTDQSNNRRTNRKLQTPWGEMTLSQAARRAG